MSSRCFQFQRDARLYVDINLYAPRVEADSQFCPYCSNRSPRAELGFEACNSYRSYPSMWVRRKKLQHGVAITLSVTATVEGGCQKDAGRTIVNWTIGIVANRSFADYIGLLEQLAPRVVDALYELARPATANWQSLNFLGPRPGVATFHEWNGRFTITTWDSLR